MTKPEESSDNILILLPEMVEFSKKRHVENMVKQHGCFYEEGNEYANECIQKYNPQGLSHDEYHDAYLKEELPWQNENTARSLFADKEIEKRFHRLNRITPVPMGIITDKTKASDTSPKNKDLKAFASDSQYYKRRKNKK